MSAPPFAPVKAAYDKSPLSPDELLNHLESREMVISDRENALKELSRIGYYRLKGYIHPFRQAPGDSMLNPGTKFETIIEFYEFDRDLRATVLRGLERIEIGLRSLITEVLSRRHGRNAHREPSIFERRMTKGKDGEGIIIFDHGEWLRSLDETVKRDKHETFIRHFRDKYSNFPEIPCWMALEMASFGELSKLYLGCVREIRTEIASAFRLPERVFGTWLHALSNLRNVCAHHGRLWNREFRIKIEFPEPAKDSRWVPYPQNRMFLRLVMIRALLNNLHDGDEWASQMEKFKPDLSSPWVLERMGFPFTRNPPDDPKGLKVFPDWTQHPLWIGKPTPQPSATPAPRRTGRRRNRHHRPRH